MAYVDFLSCDMEIDAVSESYDGQAAFATGRTGIFDKAFAQVFVREDQCAVFGQCCVRADMIAVDMGVKDRDDRFIGDRPDLPQDHFARLYAGPRVYDHNASWGHNKTRVIHKALVFR